MTATTNRQSLYVVSNISHPVRRETRLDEVHHKLYNNIIIIFILLYI